MKVTLTLDIWDGKPSDHDVLSELERVTEMYADGYTEGEINDEDADGKTFKGWWNVAREN